MSQNQSYFWQTTKRNVYLKRTSRLRMLLALMAVLTYATVCMAEISPNSNEPNAQGVPAQLSADEQQQNGHMDMPVVANEIPNVDSTTKKDATDQTGFIDAFTASISVILFTELGDKTFFIAAIMAMRHPRLIVFAGAIGALALMTVLSVVFGMAATIIPKVYTYYISTALFAIFGLKMIYEGYFMKATDAQDELEEVQSEMRKRDEYLRPKRSKGDDNDSKRKNSNSDKESDIGSVERCGGAGANTLTANGSLSSVKNPEMQHRQRKQPTSNLNLNSNQNYSNKNVCDVNNAHADDDDDDSGHECNDSDAFLHGNGVAGETLKMSTFHSSPAISSIDSSNHTEQSHCDDSPNPIKHNFKMPNNNNNNNVNMNNNLSNSKSHPMVHSNSASATLMNKNGVVVMSTSNHSINSISSIGLNANATAAAGQPLGELKQIGGSKKRLERDASATLVRDPESGVATKRGPAYLTMRIFMQAFTMTFLAEWGDRSQLTTIILAASKNVYGVITGGILGHSICTGLAVIGGRMVAAKISVRTVTIVGGIVFLGFALYALIVRPDDI